MEAVIYGYGTDNSKRNFIIFSHAGLVVFFVFKYFLEGTSDIDTLIWRINQCDKE